MLLSERQSEILHRARSQGRVEVEALAAEFEVTTQTIRRDLNDLSLNGLLARVHGGAVPAARVANVAYAASYLHQLRVEEGSWAKAVARYHSADPNRYKQYRMKVHVAWRQERAKFLAALTEAQAAQFAE